jgi:AcrR family transcriptional regulator
MSTNEVASNRSRRRETILDATEKLMVTDGYAGVSVRKVAAAAGVKPSLVQYYFPAIDDLLLATYQRAAALSLQRQKQALESKHPLHALWVLLSGTDAALAIEFMALANHRKAIADEIAQFASRGREIQAEAIAVIIARPGHPLADLPSSAISLLLTGFARAFIMEENMGVTAGHEDGRAVVRRWLEQLEPGAPAD